LASLTRTRSSRRASEKGLLPVSLDDYLAMLDWTGRQVHGDKRRSIPGNFAPILDRLAINVELWVDLTTHFNRYFGRIVGPAAEVAARASRAGRRFYRGQELDNHCPRSCRRFLAAPQSETVASPDSSRFFRSANTSSCQTGDATSPGLLHRLAHIASIVCSFSATDIASNGRLIIVHTSQHCTGPTIHFSHRNEGRHRAC
jgi:hypothetical protein